MCISNVSFIEALDYKVLQTCEPPLSLKKSEMLSRTGQKIFSNIIS